MNSLSRRKELPDSSWPWFDDFIKHHKLCKVYHDGNCHIAVPKQGLKALYPKKSKLHFRTCMDDVFDELHLQALKANVSEEEIKAYILSGLKEQFPERIGLESYVEKKLFNVYKNLCSRKKRFRRKAFLNPWNYFVTFTYDDEKQSEESFKKRIRKCLSNLHTRRGWLYMGVFERGAKTERLHFHALVYVPEGQMNGVIYEKYQYSTKLHRMVLTHPNSFFDKYGKNDFEPLSHDMLHKGTTLNYLLKYLEKSDEKIIYSRGIPTEALCYIHEDDVLCEIIDFVTKFILFNDVIDYETDIKPVKARKEVFKKALVVA